MALLTSILRVQFILVYMEFDHNDGVTMVTMLTSDSEFLSGWDADRQDR